MEGMAQVAKLIGRRGLLKVPTIPWKIEVVVVDVRSRYGTVDLLVRDEHGSEAETVWVERNRVEV